MISGATTAVHADSAIAPDATRMAGSQCSSVRRWPAWTITVIRDHPGIPESTLIATAFRLQPDGPASPRHHRDITPGGRLEVRTWLPP